MGDPSAGRTKRPTSAQLFEAAFARAYVDHGYNGTRALLSLRPNMQVDSAGVSAARMLGRARVQQAIKDLQLQSDASIIASKEKILNEIHEVREKAMSQDKLGTALNASVEKAKLAGLYEQEVAGIAQYQTLIQSLTVNIGAPIGANNSNDSEQAIEIEGIECAKTGDISNDSEDGGQKCG